MSEENKALTRRWFDEVWNAARVETIDELIDPDCVAHRMGDGGRDLRGAAGFKEFYEKFRGAFPEMRFTTEAVIAEGDLVAARWHVSATHQGDHLGMPATGRPISVHGMSFTRWRDGRMIEGWNEFDLFGMLQQLGAAPGE
jgi:steroid delta-isomerase-like uncharacterized protein